MLGVMPTKKDKALEEEVITEVVVEPEKPILEPEVEVEEPVVKEDIPPAVSVPAVEVPKKDNGWVWMLVAFVMGAVAGTVTGYMVARVQKSEIKSQNLTGVQISPTPTATPAAVEIKRADLKVQVLNGSGVAGAAGKAKTFLEGLGYADVKTGNADGDFAKTEIEIKESKSAASEMIKKDLKDKYTLADTVGVLDKTFDYDVVITLGSE